MGRKQNLGLNDLAILRSELIESCKNPKTLTHFLGPTGPVLQWLLPEFFKPLGPWSHDKVARKAAFAGNYDMFRATDLIVGAPSAVLSSTIITKAIERFFLDPKGAS